MAILVVNSDFERLWGLPYPTIQFDNESYSLAGEVGTTLSTSFSVLDNNSEDVSEQCVFSFSNQYVSIEDGKFVCEGLEVGTYTTTVTATYSYLSATVSTTSTINISVSQEQPTSISFGANSYSMSGNEEAALSVAFSVSDNLNNDITSLCSYAFSPSDKGVYAEGGYFKVDSAIAGTYNITATATYGELTATATIAISVAAIAHSISFDSNTYSLSGTEGDTITESFTVSDDLNNDVTSQAVITFNNAYVSASNGTFTVDNTLSAGSYSTTATATYGSLTATATISITLAAAGPTSISFNSNSYTLSGEEGNTITGSYTVEDNLGNDITSSAVITFNNQNVSASAGTFTVANNLAIGTYTSTATATYDGLTTTATISITITAVNYTNHYFTTEALSSGKITLTIPKNYAMSMTSIAYSLDNGATWTSKSISGSYGSETLQTTSLTQGQKVLWKGTGTGIAGYSLLNDNNGRFTSTCNFNASGNVMSLIYGDNFANQTTIPGESYQIGNFANLFRGCTRLISAENMVLPATTLKKLSYYQMFSGCTNLTTAPTLPATTLADACYYVMFSGCTALTTAPSILPATTLATGCYASMFSGCTSLTTAPALNATTLATGCYASMFNNTNVLPDTSNIDFTSSTVVASGGLQGLFGGTKVTYNDLLTILPLDANNKPCLPCTTLAQYCYSGMFSGCTSLTTAPELPATTLASKCYGSNALSLGYSINITIKGMFQDCTNLTTAPALPATTLGQYCYASMFRGCTSLTTAPALTATTLAQGCYSNMFQGCTALTTAPALTATTLAQGCYSNMFQGCTSLTTAPVLPATTLADFCYGGMFSGCTGLTAIPTMSATTMKYKCCENMFKGCTGLTTATLPATTLAGACYLNMFEGCTNLTTATLPATTLVTEEFGCYYSMFLNCTSLNNITMLATTLSRNAMFNWVQGVAASGTFTKDASMTTLPTADSTNNYQGIPSGWTVVDAS